MAPSFGRSISFPLSPARSISSSTKNNQSRHVRSISLPTCRAHPLLAHLHATTRAVRAWTATGAGADPCTTTTTSGLAHLDALHAALADLLALPEPRAALAAATSFTDRLLDALLALADAHGAFRETLLDLRRHAAEAQAALRRRRADAPRLASALRAQRAAEKDLARLASSARAAARLPQLAVTPAATVAEVEVSGVLAEALAAAASASAAVFTSLEAVSSAATAAAASAAASSKKPAATAALMSLVTRSSKAAAASDEDRELTAMEKMEQLDECVAGMEAGSDKVFRSILHARVALLNIRTHTC